MNCHLSREKDLSLLLASVPVRSGFLGAITRMPLSFVLGSFVFVFDQQKTLMQNVAAAFNPAWQDFFGTWVGGLLVIWVFETKFRDVARLRATRLPWFVLIGAIWGIGMSAIVSVAFTDISRTNPALNRHFFGFPFTGISCGIGLAIGALAGNRRGTRQKRGVTWIFRQRFCGAAAGAACCLFVTAFLLTVVVQSGMDARKVWGEAIEQTLSVLAVLGVYYRHPIIAERSLIESEYEFPRV